MKKLGLVIFIVFAYSDILFAGNSCKSYMDTFESKLITAEVKISPSQTIVFSQKLSELIQFLGETLDKVRALRIPLKISQRITGEQSRKSLHDLRMLKKQFFYLLRNTDDPTVAIEQYRDIFMDVELGWFRLQDSFERTKRGDPQVLTPEQIALFKKRFAIAYPDYIYIRTILEHIIEGKLSTAEMREVGIDPSDAEQVKSLENLRKNASLAMRMLGTPSFIKGEMARLITRPSRETIETFFGANTDLVVLKLRHDVLIQSIYAIKMIPMTLTQVETIQSVLLKFVPLRVRAPISALLGLNYKSFVIKKYLPDIETVINTPNDRPNQRLEVLRVVSAKADTLEFLTTFARLTVYTPVWIELKKSAEQLKSEPLYDKFYQQMIEAETKVVKAGDWLNPFYKPSLVDHIRVWIGPALAALAAKYHEAVSQGSIDAVKAAASLMGL